MLNYWVEFQKGMEINMGGGRAMVQELKTLPVKTSRSQVQPQDPPRGRREPNPASCPLTCVCSRWHTWVHTTEREAEYIHAK